MAVTANQLKKRQDGCRGNAPVEEATHLYQGTLAFLNAAGYLVGVTGSGQNRFAGVMDAEADNSAGVDGEIRGEYLKDGIFELQGSGFSQASVGRDAFATDNFTISDAPSASGVRIGRIEEYISSTVVRVALHTNKASTTGTVVTKTADFAVEAEDSGKTYDSTGASGAVVASLPPAVPGLKYRFRVGAAQELRLDPDGTETISLPSTGVPSAAGAYLTANAAGETVDIECVVAGNWAVFGYTGTWTAV